VGSAIVETLILTRSRHVITLDVEKEMAADAIVRFFNRCAR
jgi:esterase/lipase